MYNCAVGHPPVHQKAVSCTNRIFLPAFSSRGTEIHDDTERPVHGRARFACFSVPSVVTLTRTGPICRVSRPDRAVQRLQTAAKANADAEAKAEGASAGRGGIPGPTGNSAKSRGPATGAFDLRRSRKKPSGRRRRDYRSWPGPDVNGGDQTLTEATGD